MKTASSSIIILLVFLLCIAIGVQVVPLITNMQKNIGTAQVKPEVIKSIKTESVTKVTLTNKSTISQVTDLVNNTTDTHIWLREPKLSGNIILPYCKLKPTKVEVIIYGE